MSDAEADRSRHVLEGRRDALRAPELEAQIRRLVDEGARVIELDLTDVGYVSRSGLRVLLLADRQALRHGGRLALGHVFPRIARDLGMAGLGRVLSLDPLQPQTIKDTSQDGRGVSS